MANEDWLKRYRKLMESESSSKPLVEMGNELNPPSKLFRDEVMELVNGINKLKDKTYDQIEYLQSTSSDEFDDDTKNFLLYYAKRLEDMYNEIYSKLPKNYEYIK